MTHPLCGYPGDRDEALVTYLYDDGDTDAAARPIFEAHLTTCVRCSEDLAALRGVRARLGRWNPPEPSFTVPSHKLQVASRESQAADRTSWWREIPAWAQVAAALLFLGVSAGIANLDVRYDQNGLSVRTGWMPHSRDARSGAPGQAGAAAVPSASTPISVASQANVPQGSAPWRADLAALERQLKTEFHAAQISGAAPVVSAQPARAAADAEIVRRVRALVEESEKRQQRELALRVAEVIRDVNVQRQADLVKVDHALGTVRNDLGVKVLQNQQQMNYIIRASQRQ
jgi:hypothetical protein